jgi:hypothetical protein
MFDYPVNRQDVFTAALRGDAGTTIRAGYRWHIANVQFYSEFSGYFRIGRTTLTASPTFNPESGFTEQVSEFSPFTHCVFDAQIGFVGIARNTELAQETDAIARRVADALSSTRPVEENSIFVELTPIPNPEGFLHDIDSAYRVIKFSATFHRPNPVDADEIFQKPLAKLLATANGQLGKAEVTGEDLNREAIKAITRSTAATGNDATARVRTGRGKRSKKIRLRRSTVTASYEEEEHNPAQVLADLRTLYKRVRNDEKSTNQ